MVLYRNCDQTSKTPAHHLVQGFLPYQQISAVFGKVFYLTISLKNWQFFTFERYPPVFYLSFLPNDIPESAVFYLCRISRQFFTCFLPHDIRKKNGIKKIRKKKENQGISALILL